MLAFADQLIDAQGVIGVFIVKLSYLYLLLVGLKNSVSDQ
jgi:hypothetical protein